MKKSIVSIARINNFEYSFKLSSKEGIKHVAKALTFKNPDPYAYSSKIEKFNKSSMTFRIGMLPTLEKYLKENNIKYSISDYDYAMMWKNVDYQGKGVSDDAMELYSDAGERVRSKSEVIIANKLHNLGIAYRYEFPIKFMSGRIVYPDFYCLNVRKRREIVYEHFGMMDDPEYANNAVKKIEEYQRNGYWLGKNFRGIISLCERVAASGNTSILLSA